MKKNLLKIVIIIIVYTLLLKINFTPSFASTINDGFGSKGDIKKINNFG